MATTSVSGGTAQVGDWVELRGIKGQTARRGRIVELLGSGPHVRYRVQWDEQHESIVYPTDGVLIIARGQAVGR